MLEDKADRLSETSARYCYSTLRKTTKDRGSYIHGGGNLRRYGGVAGRRTVWWAAGSVNKVEKWPLLWENRSSWAGGGGRGGWMAVMINAQGWGRGEWSLKVTNQYKFQCRYLYCTKLLGLCGCYSDQKHREALRRMSYNYSGECAYVNGCPSWRLVSMWWW